MCEVSGDIRVMVIDFILALFHPKFPTGKWELLFLLSGQASSLFLQLIVAYEEKQSYQMNFKGSKIFFN